MFKSWLQTQAIESACDASFRTQHSGCPWSVRVTSGRCSTFGFGMENIHTQRPHAVVDIERTWAANFRCVVHGGQVAGEGSELRVHVPASMAQNAGRSGFFRCMCLHHFARQGYTRSPAAQAAKSNLEGFMNRWKLGRCGVIYIPGWECCLDISR